MYAIHAPAYLHLPLSQFPVRGAFDSIGKSKAKRRNEREVYCSRKMSYFYLPKLAKGMVLKPVNALKGDERAAEKALTEEEQAAEKALTEEEEKAKLAAEIKRKITEDWVVYGWAPWEHVLTPEADFAIKGVEDTQNDDMRGLRKEDSLDAFNKITPLRHPETYDPKKNMVLPPKKTLRIEDADYELVPHTSQWGEPEPNETMWNSPIVYTLIPPRDWPPPGWHVDAQELAFIREAHKLLDARVDPSALENPLDDNTASFPRFELFLKQYNHWVAANKDRLDKEAAEVDKDYHPGRRRTGSDYIEGMYELPFVYPGQIYEGHVTTVHLYQGAFVFIGCVHDGWVPIKGNDWYWIRHHIKVGMHVQVEVVAKRDPFRYRFPIELRFVNPNIDHLIFKKFEFPPIFGRDNTTAEELSRETGRPYIPRRRPSIKPEDRPLSEIHPYSQKIGEMHILEQELLDREEKNLYKEEEDVSEEGEQDFIDELETDDELYDSDDNDIQITDEEDLLIDAMDRRHKIGWIDKLAQELIDKREDDPNKRKEDVGEEDEEYVDELDTDNKIYDSDNDGYWIQSQYEDRQLPKLVLTVDEKDLDMDAARAERKNMRELKKESKAEGKMFEVPILRREKQMDEFDAMHKQRSTEEREALKRDISCRLELGFPIEEPGRYADDDLWNDVYTTWNPRYRTDYLGDIRNVNLHNTRRRTYARYSGPVKNNADSPSTNVQNVVNNGASKTTGMSNEQNARNGKIENFAEGENITTTRSEPHVDGTDSFNKNDVQGMFGDQDNSNDSRRGRGEAESDT